MGAVGLSSQLASDKKPVSGGIQKQFQVVSTKFRLHVRKNLTKRIVTQCKGQSRKVVE